MRINLILAVICLVGCARMDNQLLNQDKTSFYLLNDYTNPEISISSIYEIPESEINEISFASKGDNDPVATTIQGVYIGDISTIPDDTVIVYCHAAKGNIDYYWTRASLLANIGSKNHYGVLIIDYRGFGVSEGETTEESFVSDITGGINWLNSNGLKTNNLVIYGYGVGSYPAIQNCVSSSIKPSKIILESPLASVDLMVQENTNMALASSFFTNYSFNNMEYISNVSQPLLWIHGRLDEEFPITSHGELIYANHLGVDNQTKFALRVQQAGNTNVPLVMGIENYLNELQNFIQE